MTPGALPINRDCAQQRAGGTKAEDGGPRRVGTSLRSAEDREGFVDGGDLNPYNNDAL